MYINIFVCHGRRAALDLLDMQSVQAMVSSPQRGALTYLKNAGLASQNKAHQIFKSSYVVSVSAFIFFFTYGLCTSD